MSTEKTARQREEHSCGLVTAWRKSSRSAGSDLCVEVAGFPAAQIGVRDSKNPLTGPVLFFNTTEWREFLNGIKRGLSDLD